MLPIVDVSLPRPLAPQPSAFSSRFWEALASGRLTTTRCRGCNEMTFPPRPLCPRCGSEAHEWTELVGRGRLYSATRVHSAGGRFAAYAPYSVGIVDLEEGVRMLVRLLPCASALPLDSAVELVVLRHPDGPLFAARRASGTGT